MNLLRSSLLALSLSFAVSVASLKAEEVYCENCWRLQSSGDIIGDNASSIFADLGALFRAPFEDPHQSILWVSAFIATTTVDYPLTTFTQQTLAPTLRTTILPERGGSFLVSEHNLYLFGAMSLWYTGSLIAGNAKGQASSIIAAKSSAYSVLLAFFLGKALLGRARPYSDLKAGPNGQEKGTDDPHEFFKVGGIPGSLTEANESSAPWFHNTLAFSIAASYAEVYDSWIPYFISGGLIASTLGDHKHWFSDSIFSAILGIGIGRSVAKTYMREAGILHDDHEKYITSWNFYPMIIPSQNMAMISASKRF